ncbi:MAG: alpha/beta fold hydrolase, partial [Planctomycetota bacterium]
AWERQHLSGSYFDELLAYWRRKLTGVRNLELPTQRPRDTKLRHVENHYSFTIDEELRAAATQLARRANTTRFCVMLAVYHAALSRYANNTDVAIAIPVANRRFVETQQMLGLFINTVVHRNDLSGDPTFLEVLARVHQTAAEAAQHEQMPFGTLALDLQPNLNTQRFPLVQVMFNYLQRISTKRPRRPDALQIQRELNEHNPVSTRLDLTWSLSESDSDWRCLLHYDEALFDRDFVTDLATDLAAITRAVTQDPTLRLSSLPITRATPAEQSDTSRSTCTLRDATSDRPHEFVARTNEPSQVSSAAASQSLALPRTTSTGGVLSSAHSRRWLAPLRTQGSDTPLFCFPGLGGHAISFLPLSRALPAGRPIYAFQAQGLDGRELPHRSLSDMASSYLTELLAVQPEGPYFLAGWSLGGLIALDAARQLQDRQQQVALVALLDTHLRVSQSDIPEMGDTTMLRRIARQLNIAPDRLIGQPPEQQWDLIAAEAASNAGIGVAEIGQLAEVCRAQFAALREHHVQPYLGPVVMLRQEQARTTLDQRWASLCPNMTIISTPGDHYSMLQQPAVAQLASRLATFLEQAGHARAPAAKAEGALR